MHCSVSRIHNGRNRDAQDVAAATLKVLAGAAAVAAVLQIPFQPITTQQLPSVRLDDEAKAALRRLKARAERTGLNLFEQLLSGSVADWETMMVNSFRAGMSLELLDTTVQQQVRPCSCTLLNIDSG